MKKLLQNFVTRDNLTLLRSSSFLLFCFSAFLFFCSSALNAQTTWPPAGMLGGGSGSNPWQITTAAQLATLADYVNEGNGAATSGVFYKLMNHIDLSSYTSGTGWKPIGDNNTDDADSHFQGNFNGNGFTVKNLTINGPIELDEDDDDYWINFWYYHDNAVSFAGLFGYTQNAVIQNLGLENCDIKGGYTVGGLMGYNLSSPITNCYTTGNIFGVSMLGGLTGIIENSTITKCYSACKVSSLPGETGRVGGLVGINETSAITNCYATGNVSSVMFVGGLVGDSGSGLIENCYATGNISGYRSVGGLVGSSFLTTILNNYASGKVTGIENAYQLGGLVGTADESTIQNCVAANPAVITESDNTDIHRIVGGEDSYYYPNIYDNNYANEDMLVQNSDGNLPVISGENVSGTDKDMVTLKSFAFYNTETNWFTNLPWDIDEEVNPAKIWRICDGKTLPFFQWQGVKCNDNVPCPAQVYDDINDITYDVVALAGLCWFKENVRGTKYADGTDIPFAEPYYSALYPNSAQNEIDFGLLYNYEAAFPTAPATICPAGWRIPTSAEWELLNVFAVRNLKNPDYWNKPNDFTNNTNFDARGAGIYNSATLNFEKLYGYSAYWASSGISIPGATTGIGILLSNNTTNCYCGPIEIHHIKKTDAISVRCVKD